MTLLYAASPALLEAAKEILWSVRDRDPAKLKLMEVIAAAEGGAA